jgi:hypothetical protein
LTVEVRLTVEVSGNRHLRGLDPAGTWPSHWHVETVGGEQAQGQQPDGMLLRRSGPVAGEDL